MLSVHAIFVVIMLVCFFCAAIGRPATSPISLGWLGLFFWALDLLIGSAR